MATFQSAPTTVQVSYACSATYGGIIYDLWSWNGVAWYHSIAASLNLLLIVTMPPVRSSWRKLRAQGVEASSQDLKATRQRAGSAQSDDSWSGSFHAHLPPPEPVEFLNRTVPSEQELATNIVADGQVKITELELEVEPPVPETPKKTKSSKIPANTRMPAFMVFLNGFMNNYNYGTVWLTYAIFFKEHHGWNEATWAGISQTSGDLLAAIMIALPLKRKMVDPKEMKGMRWLWYSTTGQPYNVSCLMVAWRSCAWGWPTHCCRCRLQRRC